MRTSENLYIYIFKKNINCEVKYLWAGPCKENNPHHILLKSLTAFIKVAFFDVTHKF